MQTTGWKVYSTKHGQERIRATYGFQHFKGQSPYWSVTGEIEERRGSRWVESSGGRLDEDIAKHFPFLKASQRWTLSSIDGGPMHYVANALYFWKQKCGYAERSKYDTQDPLETFKSVAVLGALLDDALPSLATPLPEVRAWLESRLPRLLEQFRKDVDAIDPALWVKASLQVRLDEVEGE